MRRVVLEVEGLPRAEFRRVSGLRRRRQGSGKFALWGGVTRGTGLWLWWQRAEHGNAEPRTGTVTLLGRDGKPAMRWRFDRGRPVKWKGPKLGGGSGDVAMQELVVAHEGIRLVLGS